MSETIEYRIANNPSKVDRSEWEIHHIFINSTTVVEGGNQQLTLKSGKTYEIKIPAGVEEGSLLLPDECSFAVAVYAHTLPNQTNIFSSFDQNINHLLELSSFKQTSRERCRDAYEVAKSAQAVNDITALILLDHLVETSDLPQNLRDRYAIASQNSRLMAIEQYIEHTLQEAELEDGAKASIKGTYQYIKAGEAVPDLNRLTQLDSIIYSSLLPIDLKQVYASASATSRAMTVDAVLINVIHSSPAIKDGARRKYLSVYLQVRDGEEVADKLDLDLLDSLILDADILEECKTIYKLASDRFFDQELFEQEHWVQESTIRSLQGITQVSSLRTI